MKSTTLIKKATQPKNCSVTKTPTNEAAKMFLHHLRSRAIFFTVIRLLGFIR